MSLCRYLPVVLCLVASGKATAQGPPTRLLVAYHSQTGNTESLARAVERGAASVANVEVLLRRVEDVRDQEIVGADGILVGTPVHWASLAAPVKGFLDRVGNVLSESKAIDREARTGGAFCTGGATASGKELARIAILAAFLNMRFVLVGGVAADGFGTLGAQATTGPEDPGLSESELAEARRFGERFARVTQGLKHGLAR